MTLPPTSILPLHNEDIKEGGDKLNRYVRELVFSLQRQYEETAEAVNGNFKSSLFEGSNKYTPVVIGTTSAGVGTYTNQRAHVLRQGVMVDVWFSVIWTAHTGTGDLRMLLPYEVIDANSNVFVGDLWTQSITFTGNTFCSIENGTRELRASQSRSASTFTTIAMINAGTIRGHIRYVAKQIERS